MTKEEMILNIFEKIREELNSFFNEELLDCYDSIKIAMLSDCKQKIINQLLDTLSFLLFDDIIGDNNHEQS